MATTTIVVTYTPATSNKRKPTSTSFTVDGTAFASLTAAEATKAFAVFREAAQLAAKKAPAGIDPGTVTS